MPGGAAPSQSEAENDPSQRRRKRVAISLRRGFLQFVEVSAKDDGDPWIAQSCSVAPPSSSQ
jgi:hypothetical protein